MAQRAVVVGAGVTGLLVARALLLAGWRVDVLERSHVGAGSSSRSAAGIRQQWTSESTVRAMRYAVQAYRALAGELGASPITQRGYLFLSGDEAGHAAAARRVAMQRAAGLHDVVLLDRADLAELAPWVDADAVAGATWCPSDGFLHPAVITTEGARRVRELGGEIHARAAVVGAEAVGDRLTAVTTSAGRFAGDLFVDATNAWTGQLAPVLGAEALPVAPVKRYLWFVQRGDALSAEAFADLPMIVAPGGVYARPENPERLLMGWGQGGVPQPAFTDADQDTIDPRHAHDGGVDAVPFEAWAQLAEVVPAFGAFDGVVATTAGFYAMTPDRHPYLAYDRARTNLLRLVGFSGHGLMFAPFTAAAAATLAHDPSATHVALPTGDVALAGFGVGRTPVEAETLVI